MRIIDMKHCIATRQFIYACLLTATLMGATSCLSSGDSETITYDDAAITSFALTSYSGYKFSIDQVGHLISNADSLPVGTKVNKLAVSMTMRNSGIAYIKDMDSDTLSYYAGDSVDFTQPRHIFVLSNDRQGSTEYVVKVNVHQQKGEELTWTLMGNTWTPGTDDQLPLPQGIRQWIGSSQTEQYALSDNNLLMASRDNGITWQEELLDNDPSLLPTEGVALVSYPMNYTTNTEYVLLAGYRSKDVYPQESTARIWRKIIDHDTAASAAQWVYLERSADARYQLPQLDGLSLVCYDGYVLAFGKPYNVIYQSRDNGITWKENAVYKMPEGFDAGDKEVKVTTDADNFIWLYCAGSGQIWRGRLNRLSW